eukprot:Sspe_Gene.58684::Locus_32194_Transcript_1_1_Confidence_1.000_Length_746::g.58684::m.58684
MFSLLPYSAPCTHAAVGEKGSSRQRAVHQCSPFPALSTKMRPRAVVPASGMVVASSTCSVLSPFARYTCSTSVTLQRAHLPFITPLGTVAVHSPPARCLKAYLRPAACPLRGSLQNAPEGVGDTLMSSLSNRHPPGKGRGMVTSHCRVSAPRSAGCGAEPPSPLLVASPPPPPYPPS